MNLRLDTKILKLWPKLVDHYSWQVQPMTWTQRRKAKVPPSNIIEQELDVPVEIVIGDIDSTKPALQVLQELIALAKSTIQTLYSAAGIKVEEAL